MWAEFLKFYAFRIPQIAYASIPAFPLLFVVQLFYVEHLSAHIGPIGLTDASVSVLCFVEDDLLASLYDCL